MRTRSRIAIAGTVLALAFGTTPSASAEERTTPNGTPRDRVGPAQSVTLLSGDRVIVSGTSAERSTISVRPAAGRERVSFATYLANGHHYVIPSDASRLVATGQLDRRLFDVTLLIESTYDDAHRGSLPVIVTYDGAAPASLAVAGTALTRALPSVNGAAMNVEKGQAGLWNAVTGTGTRAAGIRKIWLDGKRKASLDRSVPQIGAPAAWAAGFTGTGVKIAVLDTGVDQTHPDLATREVAEQNFTDAADNVDRVGHGTHVASTAAGTGAKAAGKYTGVAFGAQILDAKVLNDQGFGLDSWIIGGLEWAAEQGAKVGNLSLGGGDTPDIDPVEEAVNTLSAQFGILYVIAAGNSGFGGAETIGSPGSADAALTVGAVDRDDAIAPFSSRGPRVGDGAIKPDITAPGVGIVAAKAANGFIGGPAEDGYVSLSGTSMATPHVAGAVALLAQQHPSWTGQQLKAALTASAKPNPALGAFDQGSGRVDVAKAITQTITSEPTNVSLGTALWPHDDDQPVTKPLTYHNSGTADVTLDLAVDAKGPDGNPAPNGVFSLSANRVTVPAGGQAQVSLTGDPRAAKLDGAYAGSIVATSGSSSAITPFAITREAESYNLTINVRDLAGAPTADYGVAIIGYDDNRIRFPYDPDGTLTVRLPKGRYFIDTAVVRDPGGPAEHFSLVEHPNTTLNRDTTLDAPASAAKPIKVSTPDPAAELLLGDFGFDVRTANGRFISAFITSDLGVLSVGQRGPSARPEELTTRINTQWTAPSGAFYGLAWFERGTVPTGFIKEVKQKDLATLEADLGSVTPNRVGARFARPSTADGAFAFVSVLRDVPLPSKQTEFYNTDGTLWSTGLLQLRPDAFVIEAQLTSEPLELRAGQTKRIRFNHALFGPAFPPVEVPWALRFGDIIDLFLPLFSDSSGNAGFSIVDSASTKLFRNGTLVGEFPSAGGGFFEVPPEVSDYRVTTEAVRPAIFDVTTRISAEWTFRSGHAGGNELAALPLNAVRFSPKLDNDNSARAGRPFLVPVALQLQSGAVVRPPRLAVDVSYDEGKTWKKAEVFGNLAVLLFHPADATSVSLRAKATDRDGNTVDQTIIRAYKLTRR